MPNTPIDEQYPVSAEQFKEMVCRKGMLGYEKFLHTVAKELPNWTEEDVWFDANFDYVVCCIHVKGLTAKQREAIVKHVKQVTAT